MSRGDMAWRIRCLWLCARAGECNAHVRLCWELWRDACDRGENIGISSGVRRASSPGLGPPPWASSAASGAGRPRSTPPLAARRSELADAAPAGIGPRGCLRLRLSAGSGPTRLAAWSPSARARSPHSGRRRGCHVPGRGTLVPGGVSEACPKSRLGRMFGGPREPTNALQTVLSRFLSRRWIREAVQKGCNRRPLNIPRTP